MKVKFNQVEEFCEELEKDAPLIDRQIVRCSKLWETSKLSPNIRHLSFLATCTVKGQLVELRRYCGDIWGINLEADERVEDKAKETNKTIDKVCGLLKLEVRAGHIEEE